MFKNAKVLTGPEGKWIDSDILSKAIAGRPSITPAVDGRIKKIAHTNDVGGQDPCDVILKEKN